MSNKNDLGIYLKSTKTFYYLEYGENYVNNTLDRLKKALLQRNLITGILGSTSRNSEYEVLSHRTAIDNSLEVQPIYISRHIQKIIESKDQKVLPGAFK